MLETEEVDDDYFTPVASASLANIFGKTSVIDERSVNESLKYIPPKLQNVNKQPEDTKATFCVFACALVGYEWNNDVYLQKGRLGFAIIKVIKTESHNIVLYDSNKTTLSNASVTNKLKVTIKSNSYISYFDDQRKYWSLYGVEKDIKTVTELLKTLDVTITTSKETDSNPPEPIKNIKVQSLLEDSKKPVESDTDSAVNRKTKASILNRMANMGHSVLPLNAITDEKTSDSSDTNDTDYNIKAVRHKPIKVITKRISTDKTLDHQIKHDLHANVENTRIGYTTEIKNTSGFVSDQLVPMASMAIVCSPSGNDMNAFITEQRISNSELRINMGRVTDKMDHIINKINLLETKDQNEGTASINTDILQKLLREYENKIKVYEELLQKMGSEKSPQNMIASLNFQPSPDNEETLRSRIAELENIMKKKDEAVLLLHNEIQILRDTKEEQSIFLQINVSELQAELTTKTIALKELTEANIELSKTSTSSDIASKIKSVMNDTYQAIATNFENEETYSGASIKKTIAMVIKKVTVNAINDP